PKRKQNLYNPPESRRKPAFGTVAFAAFGRVKPGQTWFDSTPSRFQRFRASNHLSEECDVDLKSALHERILCSSTRPVYYNPPLLLKYCGDLFMNAKSANSGERRLRASAATEVDAPALWCMVYSKY